MASIAMSQTHALVIESPPECDALVSTDGCLALASAALIIEPSYCNDITGLATLKPHPQEWVG
jgi:hypothetical protein